MYNVSVLNATDPLPGESLIFTLSAITEAVLRADKYVPDLPTVAGVLCWT